MSAKSVRPNAHSDHDGVELRIKRMQELFKNADLELRGMETDYRSATEKFDKEFRYHHSTILEVYEDVRALTIQCISDKSKIPQREAEEFSIDAKAKEISSMVGLLNSKMLMLTRKLRDAEHKETDLIKQLAHFRSKQDQRIKELESRNKVMLEHARKEKDIAYKEGMTNGYEKGMLETKDEISKITRSKDNEIKELKTKHKQVKDTLDKTTEALQKEKEVTTRYSSQLKDAYTEIEQLRTTNQVTTNPFMTEELQRKLAEQECQLEQERSMFENQIQDLQRELSRAKDRMDRPEEMPVKESTDESSLENINVTARPMKIAEDYTWLMSWAWLDAKSALEDATQMKKSVTEADKIILLFDILMTCEGEARAMHAQIMDDFKKALREPIQRLIPRESKDEATGGSKPKEDLPEHMLTSIGDYFKQFSDKIHLEQIQQRVVSSLEAKYKDHVAVTASNLLKLEVFHYITESVRVAWKMAIQRPPMKFEANQVGNSWTKGSFLELIWGSNPNLPNAVVQYYKNPTLVHAGDAMVKGTVFVHSEKNPE